MNVITREQPVDHTSSPEIEGSLEFLNQRKLIVALVALIPGALTVFFAFHDGGYFPGAIAIAAVELALLLVLWICLTRIPWEGFGVALIVAAVALGFLAAWTLASQGWSDAPIRAITEYDRVLLYLLALIFFGSLGFSVQRMRWMAYGVAAGIVAVCAAALVARTVPTLIGYDEGLAPERLGYPLSYWNSLGLLATIGIVLCTHFACSTRDAWFVRVAGAASVPLLATVLFYTLSRGATWVAAGAVVAYVLVGRPRGLISGALSIIAPTAFALMAADPVEQLTANPSSPSAVSTGHRMVLTVGLCVCAAAALRVVLLAVDSRVDRIRVAPHLRRPLLLGGAAAGLLAVVILAVSFNVPGTLRAKYEDFTRTSYETGGSGAEHTGISRLTDAQSNGRSQNWAVAKAAFHAEPLHGTGAGTWELEWTRERPVLSDAQDALSLYYETLGDLGLPGLIAVVAVVLLILGAFLFRARGPDRALFGALFAAGLAWAVHAGVDLDWEMPALTFWLFALGGCALARHAGEAWRVPRWTAGLRVIGVLACVAVAILPAKVALSQHRIDSSLDALQGGDCATARKEARRALDVVSVRPTPYHVIAYCDLGQGRPRAAVIALRQAVAQDPDNWEFHHALAVARARGGLDPRPQARVALRLSPLGRLTVEAAEAFKGSNRASWRRAGYRVQLTAPGPPSL